MMPEAFGSDHYVPVLRGKRAELKALAQLSPIVRAHLTPILELPPSAFEPGIKNKKPAPKDPTQVVDAFLQHASGAAASHSVFADFGLLDGVFAHDSAGIWTTLSTVTAGFQANTIPVFPFSAPDLARVPARFVIEKLGRGCGIRVTAANLRRNNFAAELVQLLAALGVTASHVDLLIDLSTNPTAFSHDALRNRIPQLSAWRTWTVLSGVFPRDLTQFKSSQQIWYLDRTAQTHYRSEINSSPAGVRIPTFGDFTTQHAAYFPSPKIAGSASIRYTLSDKWLILRGEQPNKAKNGGFQQMYGHTALLRGMQAYYGSTFSWGDDVIDKCVPPQSPGNAESWLAVGICHHMSVTAVP